MPDDAITLFILAVIDQTRWPDAETVDGMARFRI